MIFNEHIDRLVEISCVKEFMVRHDMNSTLCNRKDDYSLLIYRLPYVLEIYDALIENYLFIRLSSVDEGLVIEGNSALGCCLSLGLQDIAELRARSFEGDPQSSIFLSFNAEKMGDLASNLEAINKLLPVIKERGLKSMLDGTFDERHDFKASVRTMYQGLKERYAFCISSR